jgi:hypothetical protein
MDECLKVFTKISSEELNNGLLIQYDYLQAYLDLYVDYPKFETARKVCNEYLTYPVLNWRNKFIDLANQLAEFDGEVMIEKVDDKKGGDNNKKGAEKEEYFDAELVDGSGNDENLLKKREVTGEKPAPADSNGEKVLKISHKNIDHIHLSYYEIDLEIMFSRNPFISQNVKDFSFVKANYETKVDIKRVVDFESLSIEIPQQLRHKNLFIQLTSGAHTKSLTYFPTKMKVFTVEAFGQVTVTDLSGRPLSKVYVKCFKKATGSEKTSFHKDGYTDLRGSFDYVSLNLESLDNISMFSLLVSGAEDNNGAVIKEAKPPKSQVATKVEARKIQGASWKNAQALNCQSRGLSAKYHIL